LLDGVDLEFRRGDAVAIVGPNGAGTSTLVRLLSGDLRPTSGRIVLDGLDIGAYGPRDLAMHRAVLSQRIDVSFPFTVEDIVRMGVPARHDVSERALDALLEEAELTGLRDRLFPTLSGGEQQRAHFARCLLQLGYGERLVGNGTLLLDEPTSSLDLRHQIKLLDLARARARNGTIVIAVLHDINLAVRFAERVVVLVGGRVAREGTAIATITPDLMQHAFSVTLAVGRLDDATPYVLQQRMSVTEGQAGGR
jgi:iron complex transport system ATP-binding protein